MTPSAPAEAAPRPQLAPIARRLALIVLLFVLIVVTLLALVSFQSDILKGVRAYVGGEALWSKGQKDAVYYLTRYASTGDDADWHAYAAGIAIPLGDRRARREMESRAPDPAVVREGFLAGRNHPDDIDGMASLFHRFQHIGHMAEAVDIWRRADRYLLKLARYGDGLRRLDAAGHPGTRSAHVVRKIEALNRKLTPLEEAFSRTLGEGARQMRLIFMRGTYAIAALLLGLGVLSSWMLLRNVRQWEVRYHHLLDTANDAILVVDLATGRVIDANRKAAEMTGVPHAELVGLRHAALYAGADQAAHRALFEERIRTGQATGELHLRHRQGQSVPVEVSASLTELGGHQVIQAIVRDVTERHRAEQALRESEERWRRLFEDATDLVYMHHLDGRILAINRAASRVTGWTLDEARQRNIADMIAPEHLPLARAMLAAKLRDDAPTVYELTIVTKDGRHVPLEVSTRLVMVEGRAAAVQGIARDITERKQAEAERAALLAREQTARADAEAANRTKDEFLATLSHELRTPLNAILIWGRLLRRGGLEPGAQERALEVIERNARLQTRLIEDLLDVSRILAGKLHLEMEPVELATTVQAAVEAVQAAADAKEVRLTVTLDPDGGLVSGDAGRLQQVVWNLLANAIKFTATGGRVDVALARADDHAVLRVADTGIGIAPEFLPHLFERFRQADSTTTRAHGGLGLGLAIVRHLVDRHGGTVQAESAGPGCGATFVVRLPLLAGTPAMLGTPPAPADDRTRALTGVDVLVVDDDADTLDSVRTALDLAGAAVRVADSAEAALDALDGAAADVVVLDIGMPGHDGYALLAAIRARTPERGGRVAAVALTAYARPEDRDRALAAGFQVHVAKPVDPARLVGALQIALAAMQRRSPAA